MIRNILGSILFLSIVLTGFASAGIIEDLTRVEIVGAVFGTVPQGQSKTTTFESKFGIHLRDLTFQVISVPAPITVSPMTGTIDGRKFTWSATMPASAAPGDYKSQLSGGAFVNPIVIKIINKSGNSSNYNFPVSGIVVGFPYSMNPAQVDFGFLASSGVTRTFELKRIAFGSGTDDYQVTATDPFTVNPGTGSLTGSQAQTITVGLKPGAVVKSANGTITIKDVKSGIQKTVAIKGQLTAEIKK